MNKEEYKKIKSLLKKIHKMYIKKRQEEERKKMERENFKKKITAK